MSFSVDSEKALAPSKEIDDDNINLNADGTEFYSVSFLTKEMKDIDSSRLEIPITNADGSQFNNSLNYICPSSGFRKEMIATADSGKTIKNLLDEDFSNGFRTKGRECNNVAVDYINATEMVSLA